MEKIIDMLKSSDKEMVELGMTLCLQMSPEWCLANLPSHGHMGYTKDGKSVVDPKLIKIDTAVANQIDGILYVMGDVGIVVRYTFLMCRKLTDFRKASLDGYKWVFLNNE